MMTLYACPAPPLPKVQTLSLHDALPIWRDRYIFQFDSRLNTETIDNKWNQAVFRSVATMPLATSTIDRKSTRLNSSHLVISYAVFCLKKKNRYEKACKCYKKACHERCET